MANRRSSFRRSAPKRVTTWEGVAIDMIGIDAAGISAVMITEAVLENMPNPTIVRIRGELMVTNNAGVSTSASSGFCTVGAMLVDSRALAAGIGSMELPSTNVGSDWMYWDVFNFGEQVANEVDNNDLSVNRKVVDSKAMRKVKPNQALVLIAQVQTCVGTIEAHLCGSLRILLKLA